MTKDAITVRPETTLKDVARLLVEHGISGVPVVREDGTLSGIVSEEDLLFKERGTLDRSAGLFARLLENDAWARPRLEARTAAEAMGAPAITIEPWRRISAAAALMIDEHIKRLPVVHDGRLVGIVTRADLVKAFVRADAEVLLTDPASAAVTIDDGDVTVAGEVATKADAEALARVIGRVPGVASVDSRLTWREPGRSAA
jgi:CBS domain-containing protein